MRCFWKGHLSVRHPEDFPTGIDGKSHTGGGLLSSAVKTCLLVKESRSYYTKDPAALREQLEGHERSRIRVVGGLRLGKETATAGRGQRGQPRKAVPSLPGTESEKRACAVSAADTATGARIPVSDQPAV